MADTGQQFLTLNEWYATELGQVVSAMISEQVRPILQSVFGYHALQLGVEQQTAWLEHTPISHKIFLSQNRQAQQASIIAPFTQIPFAGQSIDCILAPHTLSYTQDVRQTIAEIDRVLMNNGHAIFIGFNRISWWGLTRSILTGSHDAPWNAPFYGSFQLAHVLREYGYAIDTITDFFYRPPLSSQYWLDKTRFLETMGDLVWPYPGGIYLLHAQKRTNSLTRIKPLWSFRNIVIGKRYVQPIG